MNCSSGCVFHSNNRNPRSGIFLDFYCLCGYLVARSASLTSAKQASGRLGGRYARTALSPRFSKEKWGLFVRAGEGKG